MSATVDPGVSATLDPGVSATLDPGVGVTLDPGVGVTRDPAVARAVRDASIWYSLLSVLSILGIFGADARFYVPADAAATIQRILSGEPAYRLALVSFLAGQVCQVFVMLALYRMFESVDRGQARLLFALVAIMVPLAFIVSLNGLAPLVVMKEPVFSSIEPGLRQSLAMVFVELQRQGAFLTGVFWGLWLIPLGRLVIKSRLFPKVLGILLFAAGAGYVADSAVGLLAPGMRPLTSPVTSVMVMAELPFVLWLVILGARRSLRPPRHEARPAGA